jgi:hypothetical protein
LLAARSVRRGVAPLRALVTPSGRCAGAVGVVEAARLPRPSPWSGFGRHAALLSTLSGPAPSDTSFAASTSAAPVTPDPATLEAALEVAKGTMDGWFRPAGAGCDCVYVGGRGGSVCVCLCGTG